MNLALSNFAWDNQESEIIFKTLKDNNINNIECVLTKIKAWDDLTIEDIKNYKKELKKQKITPYSIQSLFYNVDTDNLCDIKKNIPHIKRLIEYSKILGIKVLVLGSPNLRKKIENWENLIVNFFSEVNSLLNGLNIKLLIEPNSKVYNGEYFFKVSEIVEFINKNKFKNIFTMIDTHNSVLENKNPNIEFANYSKYIKHIHISEPKLKIIEDNNFHNEFSNTLKKHNYNGVITYEVLKCDEIINNISTFSKIYK
jgi:sugar phosphate isomerase/epimerase